MTTLNLTISGMTCDKCKARVIEALVGVKGVETVEVDRPAGIGSVVLNQGSDPEAALAAMQSAVEAGGRYRIEGVAPEGWCPNPDDKVLTLGIEGMTCDKCKAHVTEALAKVPGVGEITVDREAGTARVVIPPCLLALPQVLHRALREAVEAGGRYKVTGILGLPEFIEPKPEACPLPSPPKPAAPPPKGPTETFTLPVSGMSCASCVAAVEGAVRAVSGVKEAQVNFAQETIQVEATTTLGRAAVVDAIKDAGYGVPEAASDTDPLTAQRTQQLEKIARLQRRLTTSILLSVPILVLSMGPMLGIRLLPEGAASGWVQFLLATPVQFWVGALFYRGAWGALKHGRAEMNTLVAVGTSAAWGASVAALLFPNAMTALLGSGALYFDTSTLIITLILLGRFLEARAKRATGEAVAALMGLAPKTALVERNGDWREIPLAEVMVDDQISVRAGERIAVDGVVVQGHGLVDASMVTGEPLPVAVAEGDEVIGGCLNGASAFVMQARKVGGDTLLSRITALVTQAQSAKPPIARLADQVAGVFVPAVIAVASIAALGWGLFGPEPAWGHALQVFVAVLIVACPCALGLATPVSIITGTGRGAQEGILFKGGDSLELLRRVDTVVFDKTGTLTEGKPQVVDVWSTVEGATGWLSDAAAVEAVSEHPLAGAILAHARNHGLTWNHGNQVQTTAGSGVAGIVAGREVRIGRPEWIGGDLPLEWMATHRSEGATVVLVAVDGALSGGMAIADPLKVDSAQAVTALQAQNIEVVLLSGDHPEVAQAVGDRLKVDRVIAGVLPDGKHDHIRALQREGKTVAMVGDGINDAPALAAAEVGIAMGSGSDIALESSDVTLMRGDPALVPKAIHLSQRAVGNIKQNLFWAFAYNTALIPLAAGALYPLYGVLLSPVIAAAAMAASSVTVVSNALRLKRVTL